MVKQTLTVEELTFLDIYKSSDIETTKKDIRKSLPIIDDSDMINLTLNVLSKLNKMSSAEFKHLDFINILSLENVKI